MEALQQQVAIVDTQLFWAKKRDLWNRYLISKAKSLKEEIKVYLSLI